MDERLGHPVRTPRHVLLVSRIIWAALLLGEVMFFIVILGLLRMDQDIPHQPPLDQEMLDLLFKVAVGMLIASVPAAFLLRRIVFGGGETIAKERFATGVILYMAVLEGVAFFGLVLMLLSRQLWPYAVVPLVAFVVQLIGFPSGDRLEGLDRD